MYHHSTIVMIYFSVSFSIEIFKELVEGLFCGTVPTCRHVRNARIRDELNCFCAEIPFDVVSIAASDYYVQINFRFF